jgi:hypothetical protein
VDRAWHAARVVVEWKSNIPILSYPPTVDNHLQRLPWDFDLDTQVSHATLISLGSTYNQTRYTYVSPSGAVKRTYLLDVNPWISEREHGNGMNVIDARWIDVRNGLYIDITGLSEMRPGVWACKNNHEYATKELWPMRETVFEGTRATVPFEYDAVLTGEYREAALVRTEFNGYVLVKWCVGDSG